MSRNEPIDPRVRLAISQWPEKAPRGAVTTFCAEHGISRKSFYELRARARAEGPAAVLEPRSRRPHSSPTQISEQVKDQAVEVRAALERSGLDHGPISVFEKMKRMGLQPPSESALAVIFRERGVARAQPEKKPRAAWRRFVYPAPNACWQLDATEYVLTRGRRVVIFQLQDDHSRLAVATLVADSETSSAAVEVFNKGVTARGVPQRLLTDNGSALNPTRRGWLGQLVSHVSQLGVKPITGKPYRPTTQGKNERFHQTLFRWLHKQPLANSIATLQRQVDAFDIIYNTERPHQGLPGRITPQQSWVATPVAEPPRPLPQSEPIIVPPAPQEPETPTEAPVHTTPQGVDDPTGQQIRKVGKNGNVSFRRIYFNLSTRHSGKHIHVAWDEKGVSFADANGELIAEHPWPPEGVHYVSRRKPPRQRPDNTA